MSDRLIIDCSVTMSWCFIDEFAPAAAAIQDELENLGAVVPAHWFLEVANVLSIAERKNRLTKAKVVAFIDQLATFDIEIDREFTARAFDHILPLCNRYALTSYDAAYLELALRRQLPLATLDDPLRAAAQQCGIPLLGK